MNNSKSLLIFNENVAPELAIDFKARIGEIYNFQIGNQELLNPNFTIDSKIDNILKSDIESNKYNCIFIPYSLSKDNYLEFIGLRFACHIRLSPCFNNLQTPIVFYGVETEKDINKLSDLGNLLFTRGLFTTNKISIKDFEQQVNFILKNHEEVDGTLFKKQFTDRITIKPSGNYATRHSITNEWSIYRWAKSLNIKNEVVRSIEERIGNNLYFKYLKTMYPIKETVDAKNLFILNDGNILFIDDEIDKGWDEVFKKICFNKKHKSIGSEFKNLDSNQIVRTSIEEVELFKPDVVILDLRLHDDDFENLKIEDITGYKILNRIKGINEGIQVIIFSATNKVWNFQQLQIAGANGFILKESPELSVDESYSKLSIGKVYTIINNSLERKYLTGIFSEIENIKSKLNDSDFSDEIINQLNLFWKMILKVSTETGFAYTYISLYMIIEIINKEYISEITEECYWDDDTKAYELKPIEKLTEWNKIAYLWLNKWKQTDDKFVKDLSFLVQKRNGFIHNDKKILDRKDKRGKYLNRDIYTKEGVLKLFEVIKKIMKLI